MKQYTLRQIQNLPADEKQELLKTMFELGIKTSGSKSQFVRLGVYIPDNLEVGEMPKSENPSMIDGSICSGTPIFSGDFKCSGGFGGAGVFGGGGSGVGAGVGGLEVEEDEK